jgi:hypothetical protein
LILEAGIASDALRHEHVRCSAARHQRRREDHHPDAEAEVVVRLDGPRGRLPNGAGRSKLTIDYFEKRLGVRATARNWKTVTKLLELTQSAR